MSSGGGRLPIIAALALALVGLLIGAMLVAFARPGGGVANGSPTPSPQLSQPIFVQITPSPSPTVVSIITFPPLPTPGSPSPSFPPPSDFPSLPPTATPTTPVGPTPTPTKKPTPTPTDKPTPTPTPTGTPQAGPCDNLGGTKKVEIGYLEPQVTSNGWCLTKATFQIFEGSTWGSVLLRLNGKTIATMTCDYPNICSGAVTRKFDPVKLAKSGAVLSYAIDCAGNPDVEGDECATQDPIKGKITITYADAT